MVDGRKADTDELVSASELADFVYCQRAWGLAKQGMRVSAAAELRRAVGNHFHEARAIPAPESSTSLRRWAFALAVLACLFIVLALVWR
jgi:hypothetical protein